MSSFTRIMHQTSAIVNSKPLHFITFSLLFLPLTIFTTTVVLFYFSTSADITTILTFKTLTILFIITPPTVTAATALITYTTHNTIHPTPPILFTSTVKSLSHSFFPLFTTLVAETILLLPFTLAILLSFSDVTESVKSFVFSKALIFCYLVYLLIFFKGVFGVAAPIAVLESKYGIASLRKSEKQLVGLRKCACYIILNAVCLIGVLLWAIVSFQDFKCAFKWIFAVEVGIVNLLCCLMLLEFVVANTVLYEVVCGDEETVESVVGYRNEGLVYSRVLYLLFVVVVAPWLIPPKFRRS